MSAYLTSTATSLPAGTTPLAVGGAKWSKGPSSSPSPCPLCCSLCWRTSSLQMILKQKVSLLFLSMMDLVKMALWTSGWWSPRLAPPCSHLYSVYSVQVLPICVLTISPKTLNMSETLENYNPIDIILVSFQLEERTLRFSTNRKTTRRVEPDLKPSVVRLINLTLAVAGIVQDLTVWQLMMSWHRWWGTASCPSGSWLGNWEVRLGSWAWPCCLKWELW